MSLVAYDLSSSDEDEDDVVPIKNPQTTSLNAHAPPHTQPQNLSTKPSLKPESSSTSSSVVKLPDASQLLSSAGFAPSSLSGATDHSSLVAAAMAARSKRGSPDSSSSLRSSKLPRGALPRSKNVPDAAARMLVPPQLSGRSNVVTEDINKLFVKKKVAVEVVPQDIDD